MFTCVSTHTQKRTLLSAALCLALTSLISILLSVFEEELAVTEGAFGPVTAEVAAFVLLAFFKLPVIPEEVIKRKKSRIHYLLLIT